MLLAVNNLLYRVNGVKSEIIYHNKSLIHFYPDNDEIFFSESCSLKTDSEDIINFDLKQYKNKKIITTAKIRDGSLVESGDLHDTLHYVCISLPHSNFILTSESIDYNAFEGIYTSSILFDRDKKYCVGS